MASSVPNIKLSDGTTIPAFGLGTWKSETGKVKQAVIDAIDIGYRHIDCAYAYQNENEVGEALKAKMDDGTIKREDIFITSKAWSTFHPRKYVMECCKTSLKDLGLDYLNLYLIHWPMAYKEDAGVFPRDDADLLIPSKVDYLETWKGMEDCQKAGLVRSIGLSNFNSEQVQKIIDNAEIKPVMNQVECHPYLIQKDLIAFCRSKDVQVTGYSPLGSPDRPWAQPEDPILLDEPEIKKIGENHGKSPAQVLIRYQLQRGVICIPKSVTRKRIEENFKVYDFELTPSEVEKIESFNRNWRACRLQCETAIKKLELDKLRISPSFDYKDSSITLFCSNCHHK
ncbi:Aldo-keto reductase family 1 member B10 [Nymphon striatum]|nr:Aldo-keto reductase family 1 member B10 [Nymphon striatum]